MQLQRISNAGMHQVTDMELQKDIMHDTATTIQ